VQGEVLDKSIIQLGNLGQGKEYSIGVKNSEKKPQFTMTGNKMEALDLIARFNSAEALAFIALKDKRQWDDNSVLFSTAELSPTDKVVFSRGYKSLASKDLVVRIKKGVVSEYLFNPNFIIPAEYSKTLERWVKVTS